MQMSLNKRLLLLVFLETRKLYCSHSGGCLCRLAGITPYPDYGDRKYMLLSLMEFRANEIS